MTSTPYMISADKLTKAFDGRTVVDAVSFNVEKGEILGFLGPNAAGKTTTMKMLTCFFPPTSGTVRVNGFDVIEQSLQVRRSIGFLPENVPLYTEMSVREYLEFAARAKGVGHLDRKNAVNSALERCNLESVEHQLIATISRGYKQRVGLAQAIVNDPPVLILDEPTVGLDPAQIKDIRELIKQLGQNSTVILSTHILPEVSLTCNRVAILSHGRILEEDSPDNLTRRMQKVSSVRVELDGPEQRAISVLTGIKGVSQVVPIDGAEPGRTLVRVDAPRDVDVRREVANAIVQQGWGLLELTPDKLSLEDVFIDVVQHEAEHEAEELAQSGEASTQSSDESAKSDSDGDNQ